MADSLFIAPLHETLYWLVFNLATLFWDIDRALLTVGFIVQLVNWVVVDALFAPTILEVTQLTQGLLSRFVTLAFGLAALGYLLAPLARIRVVDVRKALVYWALASLIFVQAPTLYREFEALRRSINAAFYQEMLATAESDATLTAALSAFAAPAEEAPLLPVENHLAGTAFGAAVGDVTVDGLDVALSYILADGVDVFTPGAPLPAAFAATYFPADASPLYYLELTNQERVDSIALAVSGSMRLGLGTVVVGFGIVEQLISLALSIAVGILFLMLPIALLFSLFEGTELMARSLLLQMLRILVVTMVIGVFQGVVIGLLIRAGTTLNPALTLGTSVVGSVVMATFLVWAVKTMVGSTDVMFEAMGQALGMSARPVQLTGGAIRAGGTLGSAAVTGGAGLIAGAAATGAAMATTAAAGGTQAQVAGAALAGSTRFYQATALGAMVLPAESGLRRTVGEMYEGATARRVLGPAGGLLLRPETAPPEAQPPRPGSVAALPPDDRRALQQGLQTTIAAAPAGGYPTPGAALSSLRAALGEAATRPALREHLETRGPQYGSQLQRVTVEPARVQVEVVQRPSAEPPPRPASPS